MALVDDVPFNDDSRISGTPNDAEFFDAELLTVSKQWKLIYQEQFRKFLEEYVLPEHEPAGFGGLSSNNNSGDAAWSHYQQSALNITRYGMKHLIIDLQHIFDWAAETNTSVRLWKSIDVTVDTFVKATLRRYFERGLASAPTTQAGVPPTEPEFLHDMDTYERTTFYANFTSSSNSFTVRQLRTDILGELVNIRGTATRLSDVRPELRSASFECGLCHACVEDVEQQFKYTEPFVCINTECRNRTLWHLKPESCRFTDWQKLRLQENSSEIPAGSMPRAVEVILTRNLTDRCKPGDKILMTGCLAAIPDVPSLMKPGEVPRSVAIDRNRAARTEQGLADNAIRGLRKLGVRDLGYRLVFFALDVKTITSGLDAKERANEADAVAEEEYAIAQHSESIDAVMTTLGLSADTQRLFLDIARSTETLDKLAASIAPEIFGCEYIKKGILLMLVGGVEKSTGKDNLKLRGDINVCIVGDPGTAKSQMLKFVHQFAAGRAVYAAGNTSTAAGLTVSIHKDPDQGDSVIEAGALMLADQGICCIDEFDKMDTKDMVAIHEAMEQKTISICKAGIQATLNARASILAACNPRYGRYDPSKSFRQNIKLSQPIISRFDLFFTMMDTTDRDALVARHLINLHMQTGTTSVLNEQALLTREQLRKYLAVARSCNPYIDAESRKILVDTYVAMRTDNTYALRSARVTVRQLESLVRLSEAVAKLKLSDRVLPIHVKEARKIMQNSLLKLQRGEVALDDDNDDDDDMTTAGQTSTDPNGHGSRTAAGQEAANGPSGGIVIDADEYDRIAECLVDRLRAMELDTVAQAGPDVLSGATETIVAKDDLIAWYIENIADPEVAESEQKTEEMYRRLNKIIHRMVNRDYTLIEEMRDMNVPVGDGDETEVQCIAALRLHPNLAADQAGYRPEDSHHASLPTMFFSEQPLPSADDQQNPSWTINDKDFMDYMYSWTDQP